MTGASIVSLMTLWPKTGDPDYYWKGQFMSAFSTHSQKLQRVRIYVLPDYWELYSVDEMRWATEHL
jgi:hypothetical protein